MAMHLTMTIQACRADQIELCSQAARTSRRQYLSAGMVSDQMGLQRSTLGGVMLTCHLDRGHASLT